MTSEHSILVENLSKRYVINHRRVAHDGLRHRMEDAFRGSFRWLRRNVEMKPVTVDNQSSPAPVPTREEFWALNNISFEVKQGDVVGIIGRNGAGKSTLLKILSRITEPTAGRISLYGRVASLLEVGTGFHQELTGRENIFLNGAILGMTKAEIRSKFDEIVAFSEVEKFLDTPVKRYSSGMYVRLAFAVAAHLEPEILIVDEVLAVGDSAFQKKCLGKMGEVAESGRTVLFVSHNMGAVQALCRKAVYLQAGSVKMIGPVGPVIDRYLTETGSQQGHRFAAPVSMGDGLKLAKFEFTPNPVETGQSVRFSLEFRTSKPTTVRNLIMVIDSAQSSRVALVDLRCLRFPITLGADRSWRIEGTIKSLPLVEGDYSIGLTIDAGNFFENVFDLTSLTVTAAPQTSNEVPIPVVYRGVVELAISVADSRSID